MAPRTRLALAALAGALLCGEAVVRLSGDGETPDATAVLGITLAAQLGFGLLALAAVSAVPGGDPVARLGLRPGRLGARAVAAAALGTVALSHALHRILAALALRDQGTLGRVDEVVETASRAPAGLLLVLVAIAVVPPVVEEVLFRGVVLRALLPRVGAAAAVGLSAVAFGLFHMDPVHGAAALVLGLYLGTVAWRAGSARPAIVCHATNNLFGVAAAALGLGRSDDGALAWIALPLLALAALCLRPVWRGAPVDPAEAGGAASDGGPEG